MQLFATFVETYQCIQ